MESDAEIKVGYNKVTKQLALKVPLDIQDSDVIITMGLDDAMRLANAITSMVSKLRSLN